VPALEWSAEVEVDPALVRRVFGAQFPELALRSVRLLGEVRTTRSGSSTSVGSFAPRAVTGLERTLSD
jgi:hypothetical protein